MIDAVIDFAMNPKILAGTMFLLGLHQFDFQKDIPVIGFFSRSNFGDMDLFMGVTPLKALGAIALIDGFILLRALN